MRSTYGLTRNHSRPSGFWAMHAHERDRTPLGLHLTLPCAFRVANLSSACSPCIGGVSLRIPITGSPDSSWSAFICVYSRLNSSSFVSVSSVLRREGKRRQDRPAPSPARG